MSEAVESGIPPSIERMIKAQALTVGFDAVGITAAQTDEQDWRHLQQYLAEGRHGDMAWMATTAERRGDLRTLWPDARSAIVVGLNYGPREDPRAALADTETAAISVYARGSDYHRVMKRKLKALARWMTSEVSCDVKVFVDTAPIMEKSLAQRAGLGWIGKHTNLVSRRFGSWLFLGEVLTTLDLTPDPPESDHCGSCNRCRQACPTDALPEPYRIEPRRCISYLTIEHKGPIDAALAAQFNNRVYGCDDCLAVCPWNRFAVPTRHADLEDKQTISNLSLRKLARLTDASFRSLFAGSAIKRRGHAPFLRNVGIALDNRPMREQEDNSPDGSA